MSGDLDVLYHLIDELIRIRLSEVAMLEKVIGRTPATAELRAIVRKLQHRVEQLEAASKE